jgi:hypothetical protein
MKKGLIFMIALLVLLSATAITFARNTATTSIAITASGVGGAGEAAGSVSGIGAVDPDIELNYSTGTGPYVHVAPDWNPVVEQPGSINTISALTAAPIIRLMSTRSAGPFRRISILRFNLYKTNW